MGLFGYNEKDYAKNTEIFKNRLDSIVHNVHSMGINATGVGKTITNIIMTLECIKAQKGKDAEAVDVYINKIIDEMESDARHGNSASIVERARNLYDEINQSRRFGKSAFTTEERQAYNTRATAMGEIKNSLVRLGEIEKEKEKLLDAGAKTQSAAERQQLGLEYNMLVVEEKSLNQQKEAWTSRANTAAEVINARKTAMSVKKLSATQVGDLRSFEKEMAVAAQELTKQIEIDQGFSAATKGLDSAFGEVMNGVNTNNSFESLVEDKKRQNLMNDMGDMPAGSATVSDDPFTQALNNMNK